MNAEKLRDILRKAGVDPDSLALLEETAVESAYRLTVHGSKATDTWLALRQLDSSTGYWPVLLAGDEDLDFLKQSRQMHPDATASTILTAAQAIDPVAWFRDFHERTREETRELYEQLGPDFSSNSDETDEENEGVHGPWPEGDHAHHEFTIPRDVLSGKFQEAVHIGLLPTRVSCEAPAFFKFGIWNECPAPEAHVAILKYWNERYGAEVVGITHDVIEARVARPPRDRDAALALANEQYLYCCDIVDQGAGTLENLAASLLGGTAWYFWWD